MSVQSRRASYGNSCQCTCTICYEQRALSLLKWLVILNLVVVTTDAVLVPTAIHTNKQKWIAPWIANTCTCTCFDHHKYNCSMDDTHLYVHVAKQRAIQLVECAHRYTVHVDYVHVDCTVLYMTRPPGLSHV